MVLLVIKYSIRTVLVSIPDCVASLCTVVRDQHFSVF